MARVRRPTINVVVIKQENPSACGMRSSHKWYSGVYLHQRLASILGNMVNNAARRFNEYRLEVFLIYL